MGGVNNNSQDRSGGGGAGGAYTAASVAVSGTIPVAIGSGGTG
jgi:hypothetical protein